jgi:4-amino-4-deoxy-L-arabinose transferase-like glycosyltransferase
LLVPGLRHTDPASRQRGLKRWVLFALVWQSLVIAGVFVYAFAVTRTHRSGFLWIAPPIAALLGTALPYQLAVMRLARAGRE